ncbi:MAG: hypothetical protein Q4C47_07365, partial [Planctomycetia bacterium]|nr:hypothetical protein [Planctomycetia bacterium]
MRPGLILPILSTAILVIHLPMVILYGIQVWEYLRFHRSRTRTLTRSGREPGLSPRRTAPGDRPARSRPSVPSDHRRPDGLSGTIPDPPSGTTPGSRSPSARSLVIVPCCGDEPGLAENLRSLMNQDHPYYRIRCVVASESDAAVPRIREIMELMDRSKITEKSGNDRIAEHEREPDESDGPERSGGPERSDEMEKAEKPGVPDKSNRSGEANGGSCENKSEEGIPGPVNAGVRSVELVIAGTPEGTSDVDGSSPSEGFKIHNLRAATRNLPDDCETLAFFDSDVRLKPWTLRALTTRLEPVTETVRIKPGPFPESPPPESSPDTGGPSPECESPSGAGPSPEDEASREGGSSPEGKCKLSPDTGG